MFSFLFQIVIFKKIALTVKTFKNIVLKNLTGGWTCVYHVSLWVCRSILLYVIKIREEPFAGSPPDSML